MAEHGDEAVMLPHPSYPHQHHRIDIYEAGASDQPVRFTAGELSNGVCGVYVRLSIASAGGTRKPA